MNLDKWLLTKMDDDGCQEDFARDDYDPESYEPKYLRRSMSSDDWVSYRKWHKKYYRTEE